GAEARLELGAGRFDRAVALYLEQLRQGDARAVDSLRIAARAALSAGQPVLERLVHDLLAQQVITAYLLARDSPGRATDRSAARLALGDLGSAELAPGRYAAALECFRRVDSQTDADYVAERVMTIEELRAYVDRSPAASVDRLILINRLARAERFAELAAVLP